jgi:hypothetical protein
MSEIDPSRDREEIDALLDNQFPFRYRVFASVDVVGSTTFKSQNHQNLGVWVELFRDFYREFPEQLRTQYLNCIEAVPDKVRPPHRLSVWKFIGDEILFDTEVANCAHVWVHCAAFCRTVREYSKTLRDKHRSIDLKATLWGAGFPVNNAEVEPSGIADRVPRDYLGPEIDLGFRLTKWSSPRRTTISAGLAWLLAHDDHPALASDLRIFCDGVESLRGVMNDRPYPRLWIDQTDGRQSSLERLLDLKRPDYNPRLLTDYLRDFFASADGGISQPFLLDDSRAQINEVPTLFKERRRRLFTYTDDSLQPSESSQRSAGRPAQELPSADILPPQS